MPYLVRAFPLIRPVADLRAFVSALSSSRQSDTGLFYGQYGVSHESVYVQETPNGNLLIVLTVLADDSDAAPRFAAASEEFQVWFKSQVLYLTGIDPNVTPMGPPTTKLFSWTAAPDQEQRTRS
jgi:hypothetical protein